MFKKTLAILAAIGILFLGCATKQPAERKMPYVIQTLSDNIDGITIIDWRNVENNIWFTWIDNHNMSKDCDYVVIIEVIDIDKQEFGEVFLINEMTIEEGRDPCEVGYEFADGWEKESEQSSEPKKGI